MISEENGMEIEIVSSRSKKEIAVLKNLSPSSTVRDVKQQLEKVKSSYKFERISLKQDATGKPLRDDDTLAAIGIKSGSQLYFKDLGPQIGWKTVFLVEYAGPLAVYLWFYQRPWLAYGDTGTAPIAKAVHLAAICWTVHYSKRILETLFVHRFSNATMPLLNIFKNSAYYWGFAAYVAYHVNHPLYTPPPERPMYYALVAFMTFELGNLSIHLLLRDLRPPGTKQRRVPYPNSNPLTFLFNFVSCPNYTYEFASWTAFTVMTYCLPAGLFALAGLVQMTVWALKKHNIYLKEFNTYPRDRTSIIPFII